MYIYQHVATTGKGWVVSSNQIIDLKPANLMEEIIIESQLIEFSSNVLKVEMTMWNAKKTSLKSVFWTSFAYFDTQTQRRADHPDDLMKLFEEVCTPVDAKVFEKRSMELLQMTK